MAISDKEQLRQMLIALLDTDTRHGDEFEQMRDSLERIDALLTRMPPQMREHFVIKRARIEIAVALRRIENL
jgi:hypothetical protein